MAISLTTSTISSFNLDRQTAFQFSKLSPSTSLRFAPFRRLPFGNRKSLSFTRPRRILPRVEAKKQKFSSFDEMLANSDKPVLVDFYATWCGPCQFMGPVLNEVSNLLKDKIQVVKIDTEKYPSIADKYRIEALPTFIIFREGQVCDRFEGALTADKLIQRIQDALKVSQ
ncbi:thioredoxin Y1, chloroplastic [Magnolia sinica]|uniref:thioredoxin Y1, chloroplastic n=1 Tax=Magnolia sinica TaxID=86752 RepID=UPI00265AC504|nr:thioredoxin Y1, chloroplastic [Magnolia sinica]XP_058091074.1 thioredoxin Y1, chloroplastic [Magnolia sinica]